MILCNWPCQKCIQVFEVIKMEPKYEIYVNPVIKELNLVDSSYSKPIRVTSNPSEEEDLQMQPSPCYVHFPIPLEIDQELEKFSRTNTTFDRCSTERETLEKCFLYKGLNAQWELEKLSTILKQNLSKILQNTGMFVQVICVACIEVLEGTGNDGLKYDFSDQGIKVRELVKRLLTFLPAL